MMLSLINPKDLQSVASIYTYKSICYSSIGSLGKQGEAAAVEEVHVKNCTLNATQNGLRIKTWQVIKVFLNQKKKSLLKLTNNIHHL